MKIQSNKIETFGIKYHDYDSDCNIILTDDVGKVVQFYDEVEAEEYAEVLHGTEGVYAWVVTL